MNNCGQMTTGRKIMLNPERERKELPYIAKMPSLNYKQTRNSRELPQPDKKQRVELWLPGAAG